MTNIAELLKDAPKGMKLYSPLFGEVRLVCVTVDGNILVETESHDNRYFAYNGVFRMDGTYPNAECLLFPSNKVRTWVGWTPPVKPKFKVGDWVVFNNSHNSIYQISEIRDSYYTLTHTHGGSMTLPFSQEELLRPWTIEDAKYGDVLVDEYTDTIGIFEETNGIYWHSKIYCAESTYTKVYHHGGSHHIKLTKPATKEQRDQLFKKMKEAGYQWDENKKELRKIQSHYDIANFHAGMPVLVRDADDKRWSYVLFSHSFVGDDGKTYFNAGGWIWNQCIPFDENKHLLGTTDMPSEEFINW